MTVFALITHATHGHILPMLQYIGPDVFMPLLSALAAIMGALLLFWQKVVLFVGKVWRLVARRRQP
jgi:hypothetical protein